MNEEPSYVSQSGTGRKAVIAVIVVALAILAWIPRFDSFAHETVDAGIKRAAIAFAVARSLNAVISMAQGTEITIGVGLGANISVGEILDPVNDMVETFGDVMLVAALSFGVQKLLLLVGSSMITKMLLTVVSLAWALALWFGARSSRLLTGMLMLVLVVRFSVPVATVAGDAFYGSFLRASDEAAIGSLKNAEGALSGEAGSLLPNEDVRAAETRECNLLELDCYWEKSKEKIGAAVDTMGRVFDVKGNVQRLNRMAEEMMETMIRIMASFIFQTILMPIGFIWLVQLMIRATVKWAVTPAEVRAAAGNSATR
ncbi:MAG: hypothetical protein RL026_1277 [Pseudomonadota bacterium]